jgi:demethylmenaquinone methyltransferase/2-methoxy-6-polyprenyl-1,4-benzoquinol methylase
MEGCGVSAMPRCGVSARRRHATQLFSTLGPTYDRVGAALSLGQDPRWRRFMVTRLPDPGPTTTVLDVATGTGLVAERLRRRGFTVTCLDQSPEMLATARRRFGDDVTLVEADADTLPFPDTSFDHLTFTYLLRYVDDPAATLRELVRVVRPGGTIASLEFHVPSSAWRQLWDIYVGAGLPIAGRLISPEWYEVGRFLGPSIREFYERWPLERQLQAWRDAGVAEPHARRMSLGGGVVIWGTKAYE